MNPGAYCRDVESYLCRRNGGHLIRIVGPAFDLVCGWQARQIPLSIVFRAIDQTVERRAASPLPASRRPLRIEFCEADVLEQFEAWRRAVGVPVSEAQAEVAAAADAAEPARPARRQSLPAHLERVVLQLTAVQARQEHPQPLREAAASLATELDAARGPARSARGERREQLLARLSAADEELLSTARAAAPAPLQKRLRTAAAEDLSAWRERMPPAEYARALTAATDRLLREHLDLPLLTFE